MMFFNVLLCPGLHILIYHTQTPERKIMQHHFLIGENIMKKMEKIMIPVSVQAHHSFVDGLHIGQFVEELQNFLMNIKCQFNDWISIMQEDKQLWE